MVPKRETKVKSEASSDWMWNSVSHYWIHKNAVDIWCERYWLGFVILSVLWSNFITNKWFIAMRQKIYTAWSEFHRMRSFLSTDAHLRTRRWPWNRSSNIKNNWLFVTIILDFLMATRSLSSYRLLNLPTIPQNQHDFLHKDCNITNSDTCTSRLHKKCGIYWSNHLAFL